MRTLVTCLISISLFILSHSGYTASNRTELAVWANEAIIATYTYSYKDTLEQQKEIARYFTATAWISYTKALLDSKLTESVQKNQYEVSAVATLPPKLTTLDPTHWQATMPILVIYQNPQYQQKQHLKVVLSFTKALTGQGVRGYAITSLQAQITEPPCECTPTKSGQ